MTQRSNNGRILLLVQLVIGLTWLRAGIEKLTDPHFTSTMKGILGAFAANNPHGWFRGLLTSTAIPNAAAFGTLVELGETAVGLALVATAVLKVRASLAETAFLAHAVTLAALVGAFFMSATYWLASAWMGPADDTVNALMAAIEVVLGVAEVVALKAWIRGRRAATAAGSATLASAADGNASASDVPDAAMLRGFQP